METLPKQLVIDGILALLKEVLEGPERDQGTWVVSNELNAGIIGTLERVSAEQASRPPRPGGRTLAAHAEHVRFALVASRRWLVEGNPDLDWNQSWIVSTVDEAQWERLRSGIHDEHQNFRSAIQSYDRWDFMSLTGAMASAAHAAYHLGAMRQMVKQVQSDVTGERT